MTTKRRRRSHRVYDRTYRTAPSDSVWPLAQKLLGEKVVVYLDDPSYPPERQWKGGFLVGLIPSDDQFIIKWSRKGFGRTLKGIWRVHPRSLFTGTNLLPIPKQPARVPQVNTQQRSKEERMAARKSASTKASTTKKKAATKATASNGAKKSGSKPRVTDKLEGLSEARRRNIAKLIYRERSKSPATSWGDITTMIEDKYDWSLPGSMTGRRLLREYGPDEAEGAIIKQDRTTSKKKATTKAKGKTKRAAKVEEPDDEEEDEDLEDEDEEELDEEDEDTEAEADDDEEDEDEDEEEEEPPAKPKRRVKVTKGRGKKANPSK